MRSQRKAVNHIVVLHKVELVPIFCVEVKRRRERCPYSAQQLEVLHNELLFAARRKKKNVEDEINSLNGAREVTTEDLRNWMSSKRHAARKAVAK